MKKLFLALAMFVMTGSAYAFLPVSALTSMTLPVYGVYMTTDPTCTTGMTATVPLTKTPQSINFAANPVIGTASSLPASIGCVVIVVQNSLSTAWSAGTYTGTSNSQSDNIAACDNGGSETGQQICNNGIPTWPSQITTDAAAIGLTLQTATCSSGGAPTSAVVPLTLSTNSACTGNQTVDAGVSGCNTNNFSMPTSAGDLLHGTKLTAPSTSGNLKFIVNPYQTMGATGGSPACGNIAAPLFSFAAD